MLRFIRLLVLLPLILFSSCGLSVKPEQLYGKWKYIRLENPNANPPYTMPDFKLKIQVPTIEFTRNNELIMVWGGEVLAHGKFRTDGDKIQFNQLLDGGRTREFPFYVTELSNKEIIFETKGSDATRVTATKE